MFITIIIFIIVLVLIFFALLVVIFRPSNDRDWTEDQAILPSAEIDGEKIHIKNIRNFRYQSVSDYAVDYYDKTFDLTQLNQVYYILEPFPEWNAIAHGFLSFAFDDGSFLAISIEIRKTKNAKFSPVKGLFRQYELMFVLADERDVIPLRTIHRQHDVFVYPIFTTPERIREIFLKMLQEVNDIIDKPKMYNSITNNCITNIFKYVNAVSGKNMFFNYRILFPGYSDQLVYSLGHIDTELPFENIRERFRVNKRVEKYLEDPEFSQKIRQES